MPRTRLDRLVKPYRELQDLINGRAQTDGLSEDDVAQIVGCSASTIRRRMKDPGTFTMRELERLSKGLDIPYDDMRRCMFR
jgi:AraC-like DNA-binding protein